jgi:hypothetical protein
MGLIGALMGRGREDHAHRINSRDSNCFLLFLSCPEFFRRRHRVRGEQVEYLFALWMGIGEDAGFDLHFSLVNCDGLYAVH